MDKQQLKCLQFTLPSGAGGMAAQMAAGRIRTQLRKFVDEKKTRQYKTTYEKHYKMNVWYEDEKDYTIVLLLWDSTKDFREPEIVERPIEDSPFKNGN